MRTHVHPAQDELVRKLLRLLHEHIVLLPAQLIRAEHARNVANGALEDAAR